MRSVNMYWHGARCLLFREGESGVPSSQHHRALVSSGAAVSPSTISKSSHQGEGNPQPLIGQIIGFPLLLCRATVRGTDTPAKRLPGRPRSPGLIPHPPSLKFF